MNEQQQQQPGEIVESNFMSWSWKLAQQEMLMDDDDDDGKKSNKKKNSK